MKLFFIATIIVFMVSCSEVDTVQSTTGKSEVTLTINNLNDPADSMYYEAWMQDDMGNITSLGFLSKEGSEYTLSTVPAEETIFRSVITFVTIEKDLDPGVRYNAAGDTLEEPSNNIVICCVNDANQGVFSIGNGYIADPENSNAVSGEFLFKDASANFLIHTATDTNDNDLSGLWFTEISIEDTVPLFNAGIVLPEYKNGWIYEALLITNGEELSLGEFSNPDAADNSFLYSGDVRNEYTAFPGEDFIQNAPQGLSFPLDLSAASVKINLIPVYNDTTINLPFNTITLFETTIPSGYSAGQKFEMQSILSDLPTGSLEIKIDLYK